VVTATMSSPAVSTHRSPNRSTSEPPLKAETNRKNAKALTASPTAVVPTPKARANSGMAGATIPKPSATTKAMTARTLTSRGKSPRPKNSTTPDPGTTPARPTDRSVIQLTLDQADA
jgi:hypothetical protein